MKVVHNFNIFPWIVYSLILLHGKKRSDKFANKQLSFVYLHICSFVLFFSPIGCLDISLFCLLARMFICLLWRSKGAEKPLNPDGFRIRWRPQFKANPTWRNRNQHMFWDFGFLLKIRKTDVVEQSHFFSFFNDSKLKTIYWYLLVCRCFRFFFRDFFFCIAWWMSLSASFWSIPRHPKTAEESLNDPKAQSEGGASARSSVSTVGRWVGETTFWKFGIEPMNWSLKLFFGVLMGFTCFTSFGHIGASFFQHGLQHALHECWLAAFNINVWEK